MKTILRIMIIVMVASFVAGVFFLVLNNNASASGTDERVQSLVITAGNGQSTSQSMARPEGGDREGGSLSQGLSGLIGTLAKLSGITILVLALQKGLSMFGNRKVAHTN